MFENGPTDLDPALTPAMLFKVGAALARATNDAAAHADSRQTTWSVGCDSFDFKRAEITTLSMTDAQIVVIDPGMEFQFRIGKALFRQCHDDPDELGDRHARVTNLERKHAQTAWWFAEYEKPLACRFVVSTDTDDRAAAVHLLVASEEGAKIAKWLAWDPAMATATIDVEPETPAQAEASEIDVTMGTPISFKPDEKKKQKGGTQGA